MKHQVTLYQRKHVIVRLAKMLLICQSRRWYMPPLAQLAAEHRCSVRTIRRDLEALEEAGVMVPQWRMNRETA